MKNYNEILQQNNEALIGLLQTKNDLLDAGHNEKEIDFYFKASRRAVEASKAGFPEIAQKMYNAAARLVGRPLVKGFKKGRLGQVQFDIEDGGSFVHNPTDEENPFYEAGADKGPDENEEIQEGDPHALEDEDGQAPQADDSTNDQPRTPGGEPMLAFENSPDLQKHPEASGQKAKGSAGGNQPPQTQDPDVSRTPGGEPILSFEGMD